MKLKGSWRLRMQKTSLRSIGPREQQILGCARFGVCALEHVGVMVVL